MAFDCLHLEGRDLCPLSLHERRAALEQMTENDHTLIFPSRRLAENGLEAWAQVLQSGYEGMVARDQESPYQGGRTLKWLKVKVPRHREEERNFYKP
jgi:ATP-dependent DNA ligase